MTNQAQPTLPEQINELTLNFQTNLCLRGAKTAIETLIMYARTIGSQRPNLAGVYVNHTDSDGEIEAYGYGLLIEMFQGKLTIARVVEGLFYHAAIPEAYAAAAREAAKTPA